MRECSKLPAARRKAPLSTGTINNGAARPGLQHETGNEHSARWRIDGSDPCMRLASRANGRAGPIVSVRVFIQLGPDSDIGPGRTFCTFCWLLDKVPRPPGDFG